LIRASIRIIHISIIALLNVVRTEFVQEPVAAHVRRAVGLAVAVVVVVVARVALLAGVEDAVAALELALEAAVASGWVAIVALLVAVLDAIAT